jgi:hypothetical protein
MHFIKQTGDKISDIVDRGQKELEDRRLNRRNQIETEEDARNARNREEYDRLINERELHYK